jgi:hypothetical protein
VPLLLLLVLLLLLLGGAHAPLACVRTRVPCGLRRHCCCCCWVAHMRPWHARAPETWWPADGGVQHKVRCNLGHLH